MKVCSALQQEPELLTPSSPLLKGLQLFVRNFPQLLCVDDDDDSPLRAITKFHQQFLRFVPRPLKIQNNIISKTHF